MSQPEKNPEAGAPLPNRWKALSVLMLGVFMGTLDVSIVNVALPTLTREFKTDLATVQWVVVSYGLVITSFMLSVGRLGDMFSKRTIYARGLVLFTLGSLLAGLSPSVWFMIGARCFQAAGAVMMQAPMAALVSEIFPPRETGRALGLVGAAVSVGLASGPALGGLLIAAFSWHLIFLINIPLGVCCLVLLKRWVPDIPPKGGGARFDLPGSLLVLAGLSLYALAITTMQAGGLHLPWAWLLLGAAAVTLAVFVAWQKKSAHPILDLALLRTPRLSLGLAMSLLIFTALALTYMLPFYLQYGLGYTPGEVGLLMILPPLTMGLGSPLAGWWVDRWGEKYVLLLGLAVAGASCWGISTLGPDSGPLEFTLKVLPLGLGVGLFQTPNLRAIVTVSPANRRGVASGLSSLSRTLGTITGMPLLGAAFLSGLGAGLDSGTKAAVTRASPQALSNGLHAAGIFGVALLVAAFGVALLALRSANRKSANPDIP